MTGETSISKASRPLAEGEGTGRTGEALVAFTCAEEGDERGLEAVADRTAREILHQAGELKAPAIWVYPYAHLSSKLASPRVALKLLDMVEERVRRDAGPTPVHRAPFGYYKSFRIRCKGHPLSELAKTITAEGGSEEEPQSEAVKKEGQLRSTWIVVHPARPEARIAAGDFDWSAEPGLKAFYDYESTGSRKVDKPPPHTESMRRLELVDYEPGSDSGNLRWYPNGYVMKKLLEDRINQMMGAFGAMQVETPIMYDFAHPHLCSYLNRFPARQYLLKSDKREFFLRFAACFGQYLMMHDGSLSYRHLPARYYELTHFSFRREQSGELAGLRRLRSFTMPDMHTLVGDLGQAREDFLRHVRLAKQWLDDLGLPVQLAIRFVKEFFDANQDLAEETARIFGAPVLVELWDKRFFYFVAKFEANFVDTSGKAACLSTTQIDVENSERFEIQYTGEDGLKHNPMIMHTSIPGAIERNVYAILETQAKREEQGQVPVLPLWLAPVQVRFLPVKPEQVEAVAKMVEDFCWRADFDDRAELSLGKRVREAEMKWIPYIVTVGAKELETGMVDVRIRGEGPRRTMTLPELGQRIAGQTQGKPFRPINVPRRLSQRPIFVG